MRFAAAAAGMLAAVWVIGGVALAEGGGSLGSRKARGVFVAYDPVANTIATRERGNPQEYRLLADDDGGKTEVVIESQPARPGDLEPGAPVIVSWRRDAQDRSRRVATRVESPKIPKSFREGLR